MNLSEVSKVLSHALRHEPWLYEIELDSEGWASVECVIAALRRSRETWKSLSVSDLANVISSSEKKRHEMLDGRIRALYGHSTVVSLLQKRATPPPTLFHGTTPAVVSVIQQTGLLPMQRQYVHCSVDFATAQEVGKRKGKNPVILRVKAETAHKNGVIFYEGNEFVWLSDSVPPQFIDFSDPA